MPVQEPGRYQPDQKTKAWSRSVVSCHASMDGLGPVRRKCQINPSGGSSYRAEGLNSLRLVRTQRAGKDGETILG